MDFSFLAEADSVVLKLERAKRALETAKAELDTAKKDYDDLLSRSDELGIPRSKLRKLAEDRVQLLFESGLLDFTAVSAPNREAKPRKPKKTASVTPSESIETETEAESPVADDAEL
jgi:hypothetical protein